MSRKNRNLIGLSLAGILGFNVGCHDTALHVLDAILLTTEVAEFWLLEF